MIVAKIKVMMMRGIITRIKNNCTIIFFEYNIDNKNNSDGLKKENKSW